MITAAEIAHALGGRRAGQNSFTAKCPAHEDRSPSLSLTDAGDGLTLWHCHAGCSQADVRDALVARGLWQAQERTTAKPKAKPPAKPSAENGGKTGNSDFAAAIWRESVDPRGSLAERYLRGRGLKLDDDLCGRVLRFHGRCPFGKDANGRALFVPALIAAFRPFRNDDETTAPAAIHRIGLNLDGTKFGKMMLGQIAGCAVKLDADDMVEEGLGICEGIETGIAIRTTGWKPIWALGSAGAIARFAPISGTAALTIFADRDATGLGTAQACAERWQAAGREAFIRWPSGLGSDYADTTP